MMIVYFGRGGRVSRVDSNLVHELVVHSSAVQLFWGKKNLSAVQS